VYDCTRLEYWSKQFGQSVKVSCFTTLLVNPQTILASLVPCATKRAAKCHPIGMSSKIVVRTILVKGCFKSFTERAA
jgi:hypothetical protein